MLIRNKAFEEVFFVCGPPPMMEAALKKLGSLIKSLLFYGFHVYTRFTSGYKNHILSRMSERKRQPSSTYRYGSRNRF